MEEKKYYKLDSSASAENGKIIAVMASEMGNVKTSMNKMDLSLIDLTNKIDTKYATRQEMQVIQTNIVDIKNIMDTLMNKIDQRYATKPEVDDVKKDVGSIQAGIKWVVYLIVGAVIVALLSYVIVEK